MSPIVLPRARFFCVIFLTLLLVATRSVAFEWKTPPEKVTLLAVNAHPDDEGIFFGGALPYYSGVLQVPTMLLSMTSGDWNTNNLLIRENELRNAAWTYGLRYEPIFGRFRDVPSHNMTGNPYTNKMDATWDYWADGILQGDGSDVAAGHARAVNFVAEIIRRYKPEVIITHDFNGEYGHDNHKATALVVSEAYFVAADPNAAATNLVGLPPWQARKLYVHLYGTNQLFHTDWETPRDEFGGKSARQIANDGLDAHISQKSPDVSTYYLSNENYNGYDSERWGLFASTVGLDTPSTNGVAYGNFFEHIDLSSPSNRPPEFFPKPVPVLPAMAGQPYTAQTLARFATDLDKVAGDSLTFTKLSGPEWLTVSTNGALNGTPGTNDIGENIFQVRVSDDSSASDEATMRISVGGRMAASWNCNDGVGLIATDTSGENHHATLSNGSAWAVGRERGALALDGVNGCATADNVNVGSELTISAWMRPSSVTSEHAIIGEANSYTLKTSGTSLRFTTPGIKDHTFAASFSTGQWYHVAVTFKAGTSGGCKFYVNGVLRLTTDASLKSVSQNQTWIGRNQWGQNFSGLLDDIRIYRAILSDSEIAALYANHTPVFTENLITLPNAMEATSYPAQSLVGQATDADGSATLRFRKIAGPDWLNISSDGLLTGTPTSSNVGTNEFIVQVSDDQNAADRATLLIVVSQLPKLQIDMANSSDDQLSLSFNGEPLQSYQLFGSTNLINWEPITVLETDNQGRALWVDSLSRSNAYFFRVQQ